MKLVTLLLGAILALSACKFAKKEAISRRSASNAEAVRVPVAEGSGLNLNGTGFVWNKGELPICLPNRVGIQFFVWQDQATYSCLEGKSDWSLTQQAQG